MFKVDDEFQGRGTAYLSLENVRVLSEIFRGDKEINEEIVQKIREVVANVSIKLKNYYKNFMLLLN